MKLAAAGTEFSTQGMAVLAVMVIRTRTLGTFGDLHSENLPSSKRCCKRGAAAFHHVETLISASWRRRNLARDLLFFSCSAKLAANSFRRSESIGRSDD
jgi:hypothetical protein